MYNYELGKVADVLQKAAEQLGVTCEQAYKNFESFVRMLPPLSSDDLRLIDMNPNLSRFQKWNMKRKIREAIREQEEINPIGKVLAMDNQGNFTVKMHKLDGDLEIATILSEDIVSNNMSFGFWDRIDIPFEISEGDRRKLDNMCKTIKVKKQRLKRRI